MATQTQASDSVPQLVIEFEKDEPYVPVQMVGGDGGTPFSQNWGDSGTTVKRIGIWEGEWKVRGLTLVPTTGDPVEYGSRAGNYTEFSFERDEQITHMSLWTNKAKTRVGRIKFETNKPNHGIDIGVGEGQQNVINVGSGILVGAMGRSGDDIDKLGFVFVKEISEAVMTEMTYPGLYQTTPELTPERGATKTFKNNTSRDQTHNWTVTKEITFKESWSISAGVEFTYALEVEAGIPELVKVGSSYGLKLSVSATYSQEKTESVSESNEYPILVAPHSTVIATVTHSQAHITLPYRAWVIFNLTDGTQWKLRVNGMYKGITYTDDAIKYDEKPNEDSIEESG
jgi:hypothetical protein